MPAAVTACTKAKLRPILINGCIMLLSPARGRGWERGRRRLLQPPLLASPPSGGEEYEREEYEADENEGCGVRPSAGRTSRR
jgi:hypothetical protein